MFVRDLSRVAYRTSGFFLMEIIADFIKSFNGDDSNQRFFLMEMIAHTPSRSQKTSGFAPPKDQRSKDL